MHFTALMAATMLALASPSGGPGEWLYAQTGNGLRVYDPETGELLQKALFPGLINNRGLVYDGGRLYMMNQNLLIWRDFMVEFHPATSRYMEIGMTGFSIGWADLSLVRDPTTDKYYVHAASEIYEADMTTGELTYLSRLEQGVTIITAIAIDSRGSVFGYGAPSIWHAEHALYKINFHSGELELLGNLKGSAVLFKTLAFDSLDRLWGAGYGPFTQQKYRLYRVDLETLDLHAGFPFPSDAPWASAIAFGPKPDVEGYCEPKTNSQGCAPAIAWKGLPSATAHFGFEVRCTDVVADSPGFLMLGLGGRASLPFAGGTLCVAEPILRTTPQTSGGSGACTGAWSLDANTWLFTNQPLAPGDAFTCQWWGRDPGRADPTSSQLSDALEVVLLP